MDFLQTIVLRGFKSIRDVTLELRPLNILVGANGAGKSNLVLFFKMLSEMMGERFQQFIGTSGRASRCCTSVRRLRHKLRQFWYLPPTMEPTLTICDCFTQPAIPLFLPRKRSNIIKVVGSNRKSPFPWDQDTRKQKSARRPVRARQSQSTIAICSITAAFTIFTTPRQPPEFVNIATWATIAG